MYEKDTYECTMTNLIFLLTRKFLLLLNKFQLLSPKICLHIHEKIHASEQIIKFMMQQINKYIFRLKYTNML